VKISSKQAQKLGLRKYSRLSPVLEKSCLRLNANESYQKAEQDLKMLTGIDIGHSNQHRLVQKVEIPLGQAKAKIGELSVDGGKIKVRAEKGGQGEWRDYKAVSVHGDVCTAFFQDQEGLENWSEKQPFSRVLTCVGDGHDGVWNLINLMGNESVKREVLDWYHLKENLYRVGGSLKRLKRVEKWLWQGLIEEAIAEFTGCNNKRVQNFQGYLRKHQSRIPEYGLYQLLGITIGSGSVESMIKQIGARIKLAGAQWKKENIPKILRLRCAYLNDDAVLSINA
jgi:hypothetical protein